MGELRKVLGETAKEPQYIATVYHRGYRFMAPVTPVNVPEASASQRARHEVTPPFPAYTPPETGLPGAVCVDREADLARLHQWFWGASQGHRQVVFITGEAGIWTTTLVDTFLAQMASHEPLWVGRGQCLDHYGAGEAYLPLLEALGQMGRAIDGAQVVEVLRQYPPSWLLRLPALWVTEELPQLQAP